MDSARASVPPMTTLEPPQSMNEPGGDELIGRVGIVVSGRRHPRGHIPETVTG